MTPMEPAGAAESFLEAYPDTRHVELLVCDMNGMLRGKRAPVADLVKIGRNGVNHCAASAVLDSKGATFDTIAIGGRDGDPDVKARIVPGTLAPVPWAEWPTAQALLELSELDGEPFRHDPRHVLRRALEPLSGLGLRPVIATELEFYLIEHDGETFRPRMPRIPGSDLPQDGLQYATIDDLVEVDGFLGDLDNWCRTQNIPAGAALSEFAPGQFEINLTHVDDPLRACEHALLLKRAVKAAARANGLAATFMAKPFQDIPGSGLHVHMSLLDERSENVFSGHSDDGPVSGTLRHAVGGLQAMAAESMAVFAPNANSYRRYTRGAFAPGTANWGINHRGVSLRVPLSTPRNTRIEHRIACADANPYLVVAALLAAVHHGIANRLNPGPVVREREEIEEQVTLPVRWPHALDVFEAGSLLPNYFGKDYCALFLACRREEEERFHAEISNRDYEWYLRNV
ncbi:glutamine synthetase family protein [Elongatibacter sediminis]|uniref:Glutamine synthetase family protein n=1 Tax=Elongatibacter sediminis TaxID=3119006 RepID=A0AAW9RLL4_9GAMM